MTVQRIGRILEFFVSEVTRVRPVTCTPDGPHASNADDISRRGDYSPTGPDASGEERSYVISNNDYWIKVCTVRAVFFFLSVGYTPYTLKSQ